MGAIDEVATHLAHMIQAQFEARKLVFGSTNRDDYILYIGINQYKSVVEQLELHGDYRNLISNPHVQFDGFDIIVVDKSDYIHLTIK